MTLWRLHTGEALTSNEGMDVSRLDDLREAYEALRTVEYQLADATTAEQVADLEHALSQLGVALADTLADIMGWNGEAS